MGGPGNWGNMDPNSQHQMWSHWTFRIFSTKRIPPKEIESNAARWLAKGFQTTVAEAKVTVTLTEVTIECRVEGIPAHDPGYVESVKKGFGQFVYQGWGPLAIGKLEVKVLAGDRQDGKPADQLLVMPTIPLEETT